MRSPFGLRKVFPYQRTLHQSFKALHSFSKSSESRILSKKFLSRFANIEVVWFSAGLKPRAPASQSSPLGQEIRVNQKAEWQ